MNLVLFALTALILLYGAWAKENCPRDCSGHGKCAIEVNATTGKHGHYCACYDAYDVLPDCSAKKCNYGLSWASKATAANTAHVSMECANQGMCDRNSGICKCFPGFEGNACDRLACECGEHGTCMTLSQQHDRYLIGSTEGAYSTWDADQTTSCVCDYGFMGPGCNMRMCPKGDDPMSTFTGYKSIKITTSASDGKLAGKFKFTFNGEYMVFDADATYFTSALCKQALEGMPNFGTVSCTRGTVDANSGAEYVIRFKTWPAYPHENTVYSNDGNPAINLFGCEDYSITGGTDAACALADVDASTVKPEYTTCSNRGVCDFATGQCSCFESFYGSSCNAYTYAVREISSALPYDVMGVQTIEPGYDGNLLRLKSAVIGECDRTGSCSDSDFKFVRVTNTSTDAVTEMDGEGNIDMFIGDFNLDKGGLTINSKGLVVSGGLSIMQQGLVIAAGIGVTINTGGLLLEGVGKSITLDGVGGVKAIHGGVAVTGGVSLNSGDLDISGGLMVTQGGMTVEDGININGVGLSVEQSGMKIPLGLTVFSRGVYVYNKISLPYDGFSVNGLGEINGGLVLEEDGVDVRTEGVLVSHSTGLNLPNKLTVSNGITIEDVGLYLFGGMSIQDTGLVITAGMEMVDVGLSVEGGGLRITGGLSVLTDSVSSDMIVQAGVTVKNGGVSISATGLTVETEGLKVTKDGLSIEVEGLVVTGGLSMDWFRPYDLVDFGKIGGIDIEDGATIHDGGLWVLGKGLTISADGLMHEGDSPCVSDVGMKVTGGVTINAGGLTVTGGGISITGGLKVTDSGVSVMDAGLKLEGGLTITGDPDYSLLITGGLTSANALWTAETIDIEADGLTIVDGLTVHNAGVSVDLDGLTITAGGLRIEDIGVESDGNLAVKLGGLTVFTDGLEITAGSISIFEAGLVVSGGLTVNNGGLSVTDFIVSYGTMSVMDGGMTVETDGVVLSGHYRAPREVLANVNGITLADIGLWIATGGVTIGHQGLHTVKGICIHTGGLLIKEVPPETSLRYTHNEGLTISTGGLSITAGGLNIGSSGLTGKKRDGLQITGGVSLETSNLVITAGGLSVHDAGLNVQDGLTINTGGLLDMHNMCIVDVGLAVTGGMTIREDGLMMPATSTGVEVKADGMKVIDGLRSAGVKVTGGLTIPKDGLKVIDGVRIGTLGLRLDGQIRKPKGNSLTLTAGGLRVSSGDVTLASPGYFKLLANNKLTIAEGNDFEINHGLTISTGGIIPSGVAVAGGMAIADLLGVTGTFDLTGGLSVRSGGLSVLAGGISLTADDLDVGDDLMVTAGDVDVDGLMLVNDGVTIQNSGVVVSLGGMTVNNHILVPAAGIQVTGDGLTVNHDGIKVTGGATITGVGVTVTGGFSIASEGLSVLAGGLTVQDGLWLANALAITDGLTATGGIYAATGQDVTVHKGTSGGLQVDTSMFVSGDVKTALGVTITANGLRVTGTSAATDDTVVEITSDLHSSHTLYVARNGVVPNDVTVASGLSVSTGIVVTGGIESDGAGGTNVPMAGMTVFDLGTKVTGGVSIHQVGLDIPQAGLTIASSLWVMDDGLHVTGGFTAYDDGMTITEGGLNVLGGMSVDGGMTIVGSVTTNILRFAADVTVSTVGIKAGGEVCVLTNGMKVETDDMHVEGGVTVVDTGVTIDKGIHVVRKSLYVHDTGLTVAANGVQIGQGGLQFNDGLTVQLGGMRIGAANSPLVNHHLYMHGKLDVQGGEGMSINAGGMRIYGRLTVRDTGLDSTGLLKIGNSLKTVGGGTRPGVHILAGGIKHWNSVVAAENQAAVVSGGIHVVAGGLNIPRQLGFSSDGSAQVEIVGTLGVTGGVSIASGGVITANAIEVTADGMTYAGGFATSTGDFTGAASMTTSDASTTGEVTGGVTVANKLRIQDPLIVEGGMLEVSGGGITVHDVGGVVAASGMKVTGGVSIAQGTVIVSDGDLTVGTGARINRGVGIDDVQIANKLTITNGGLLMQGGLEVTEGGVDATGDTFNGLKGINLAGGMDVLTNGAKVTGGALVSDLGVQIFGGGLVVEAGAWGEVNSLGDVKVGGGVTVDSGGLIVETVVLTAGNADVTGEVKVTDSGTVGTALGAAVNDVGVRTSGAITVSGNGGLSSTLHVKGATSIVSDGLKVTGGISVRRTGVHVSTKVLVTAGGVKVMDGGALFKGGLTVTGGLSLTGSLILPDDVTANALTVARNLLVADAVVVTAGGMLVSDGGSLGKGGNHGAVHVEQDGITAKLINLDGELEVRGDLTLGGELSINTGGLRVRSNGVSVQADGLLVKAGGLSMHDELKVPLGGMLVKLGGVLVQHSGVMMGTGQDVLVSGGGMKVSGSRGGVDISADVEVAVGDMSVAHALDLAAGDLTTGTTFTLSGGLDVTAVASFGGAAVLTGGLTVTTTGINAKLSIADGGLSVLGTVTLGDAGLTSQKYIVTPVLSVMDEGLVATGGMSIIDSGLSISASGTAEPALEVMDLGVMIPVGSPKTVVGDGLVVTAGGMTVAGWDDLVISGSTDLTLSAGIEGPYMIVGGELGIATGLDVRTGSPAIPIRNGAKFAAGTVNWIDAVTITEELYVLDGMTVHDSMLVEAGYGDGIGSLDLGTVFDNEPEMIVFGDTNIDSGTQSGTQFSYPSDRRLKQDIELLPNAVETLHQLKGVSFRWNQTAMAERSSKPGEPVDATEEELEVQTRFGKVVGVIAQDVRKAVPEAVAESKRSDMLAVDYMKLVPVVMEALKEIHARFKAQSADPVYHRDLKKRKLRAALEALMEEYRDTEARNQELGLRLESVERLLASVPVISTGLQPLGAQ